MRSSWAHPWLVSYHKLLENFWACQAFFSEAAFLFAFRKKIDILRFLLQHFCTIIWSTIHAFPLLRIGVPSFSFHPEQSQALYAESDLASSVLHEILLIQGKGCQEALVSKLEVKRGFLHLQHWYHGVLRDVKLSHRFFFMLLCDGNEARNLRLAWKLYLSNSKLHRIFKILNFPGSHVMVFRPWSFSVINNVLRRSWNILFIVFVHQWISFSF